MIENPSSSDNDPQSPTPLPLWVRIGIGVIALIVILALLWRVITVGQGEKSATGEPGAAIATTPGVAPPPAVVNENSPEALFKLANSYYEAGKLDDAVTAYQKAIQLNPSYDAAYANLGAVYYAQQKLSLAEEAYAQANTISPGDADIIYNLGAIYLQQAVSTATGVPDQARLDQALVQIKKAIELNPQLAEPYYGLGVAYQLTGNNEEAIKAFEQFLKLDNGSDSQATDNATKILQSLKTGQTP